MTPTERRELATMFQRYAELEFRDSSAVYDTLATACAEEPGLARPLLCAAPTQRRALLYFAATQYLLRRAPAEPLAGWYPSLGGSRVPDAALVAAFAEFVARRAVALGELCARRTTQTNEPRRAALLRPALGRVARAFPDRPVSLVDLGTSAGLLLLPDRYGYHYPVGDQPGVRAGRADAPAELVMRCELRGGVPDDLDAQPVIAGRIGLDLHPIAVDDPDSTDWLRACIWPEHGDRLARLDAALAQARQTRLQLVAGDLLSTLPPVLDAIPGLPVVQASNVLTYLPEAARRALVGLLDAVGRRRDLAVVFNEATQCGAALFSRVPAPPGAVTTPTVVTWVSGVPSVEVLGTGGPHGSWLEWTPTPYSYAPALPLS